MSAGETHIFTPAGELTLRGMQLYASGALEGAIQHKVESYLKDNPFEAEALEGMMQQGRTGFSSGLTRLRRQVSERTEAAGTEYNKAPSGKVAKMAAWQAAAAVLILMVAFASTIFVMERNFVEPSGDVAYNEPEINESPAPHTREPLVSTVEEQPENDIEASAELSEKDVQANGAENTETPVIEYSANDEAIVLEDDIDLDVEIETDSAPYLAQQDYEAPVAEKDKAVAFYTPTLPEQKEAEQRAKETERLAEEAEIMRDRRSRQSRSTAEVKKEAKKTSGHVVYGKVVSGNGFPLANAKVSILNGEKEVETDSQGDFKIFVEDPLSTLRFSYRGLSDIDIPVGENEHLVVNLNAAGSSFKSGDKEETFSSGSVKAQPGGSFSEYKQFLLNQLTPYIKDKNGRVVVEFTVAPEGTLTDFEVIRGIDDDIDTKVVEIMKNGPRWKPAFEQGLAVPSRTRYRLRIR